MKYGYTEIKDMNDDVLINSLGRVIGNYRFHKNWCEENNWKDKRTWEYRQHKEFAEMNRKFVVEMSKELAERNM